jgi:DNA-binding CsgD family transcriptional regulator
VRAARAAEDRQLVADAEIALTTALFHVGEPVPEGLSARMSDVARRRHEAGRREPAWFARAVPVAAMLKWSDEFDRARTAFEACRSELQARDEEGLLFPVLFQLGELECWAGDLGAARRWTADAAAVGRRAGQPGVRAQSLYLTALVGALAGDVEAARAQAAEGLAVAETIADLRLAIRNLRVLGLVELSLGDPGRARPYLLRAVASADRAGYGEPGIFRVDGDAIETLVAAGELAHAERRSGALRDAAERLGRTSALAVAGRCAALLESARGAPERALVAAESALAHHARGHEPLERGRTLLVKGTIERRLGRRRVARGSLEAAHAAFAAVGAPLWAGRARAELARVPGRAPATGEVTPTERRVAELVAVGRTNREVAAELFLSMSAVEANLSRVYRKLGVRSRTELAVRLAHGGASPRRDPAAS